MVTSRKLRLLARYLSGECNEPERRKAEEWIHSSAGNEKSFQSLKAIWDIAAWKKERWKSRRAITSLRLKLKDAEPSSGGSRRSEFRVVEIRLMKSHRHSFPWRSAAGMAGVFLLIIGSIYAAAFFKGKTLDHMSTPIARTTNVYEQVSTKPGEQATLTLPDGIQIVLNSASQLRYTYGPKGKREFHLVGEAYFTIPPHHGDQIVVTTRAAVVRDIGTRFDVRDWPDDQHTQIAVTQGRVIVRPRHLLHGDNALVESGQFTSIGSRGIVVSPRYVDVRRFISWTEGKLIFLNDPLRDVIKQLRRKYGIKCFIADTSMAGKTLTATFDDSESVKEVLDIIALSLRLRYRTSMDSVVFVPSKTNSF